MRRLIAAPITLAVLLALDAVWLGLVSPPLYRATIGPLLRTQPDLLAAGLFYLLYAIGIVEFVVRPAAPDAPARRLLARGALLGLFAYGTFDLTAQAVLAGWSWVTVAADMAWGAVLTALVALVAHRLTRRRA